MEKNTKLYNVFFPVWFLLMIPQTWIAVFPVNFLVDSLVLILLMRKLQVEQKGLFYRKHIVPIFLFGLLADVIGAAVLFVMAFLLELASMGDELYLTLPAVAIAGLCIYSFHYCVIFRKEEDELRRKMAIIFAIATAPYTFLIPTAWVYGWN